jgi:hypothetical protein
VTGFVLLVTGGKDEMVDNPYFKFWAKFKNGAKAVHCHHPKDRPPVFWLAAGIGPVLLLAAPDLSHRWTQINTDKKPERRRGARSRGTLFFPLCSPVFICGQDRG